MSVIDTLSTNLMDLGGYLFDANKRIYFVYLLASLPLAYIAFYQAYKHHSLQRFVGYVFNKEIWWAPSARIDYALFVVNKLIKAFIWVPLVMTMVPVALAVSGWLEDLLGPKPSLGLSPEAVMALFTLMLFLIDDFSRFLLHYLLHRVPALWEFHKVHHSAKVLTPMTIYRSHPVESYLYACRMALTQGLAVGIGYYVFGPRLTMFDVAGANVFVFAFNFMGSNLRHSHVWLSWGDTVERWFISPAQHQIHHSDNPEHFDTNFGAALSIWDRLFGCFRLASSVGKLTFGIARGDQSHQTLAQTYFEPFKLAALSLKRGRK